MNMYNHHRVVILEMLGITRLCSFFLLNILIPVLAGLSPKDHMGPALVGEKKNCLHKEYDQVKKKSSHPDNFTGNIYGKSLVDKPKNTEQEMRLRRKTPPKTHFQTPF
jgi:hypothetical protein